MPLIKAKEVDSGGIQAEVLRLQDIEAEAARILAGARAEAEALLASARTQAEKIKADARKAAADAGRAEGLKAGAELGRKQAADQAKADFAATHAHIIAAFTKALHDFEARRRRLLSDIERDVVGLSCAIAGRVVKTSVQIDPNCVNGNVREALQLIANKNSLELRLNPIDLDQARRFAEDLLPAGDFEAVRFVPDETVGPGGALLRTPTGRVDATIETQCGRLLDEILSGWKEHWLVGPAMTAAGQTDEPQEEPGFVEFVQEDASDSMETEDSAAERADSDADDETPIS